MQAWFPHDPMAPGQQLGDLAFTLWVEQAP